MKSRQTQKQAREKLREQDNRVRQQQNQMLVILWQANEFHLNAADAERGGDYSAIHHHKWMLNKPRIDVTDQYNESEKFHELFDYFKGFFDFENPDVDYREVQVGLN